MSGAALRLLCANCHSCHHNQDTPKVEVSAKVVWSARWYAMKGKTYKIKECFLSLQGEGVRAGEASVFLRFAGCNLRCTKATHGFSCDTDFQGGSALTLDEVVRLVADTARGCQWIVLTGGEPALFLDPELVGALEAHHKLAIETNGTVPLCCTLDWTTVAPKRGEKLVLRQADEIKVVLAAGETIPDLGSIRVDHHLLSPAFEGDTLPAANLRHCIRLCMENPRWRLSVQQHKAWGVR